MANAKVCDRCGKFYLLYNVQNNKNVNSLIRANTDHAGKYYSHKPVELCPTCMNEFERWLAYENQNH